MQSKKEILLSIILAILVILGITVLGVKLDTYLYRLSNHQDDKNTIIHSQSFKPDIPIRSIPSKSVPKPSPSISPKTPSKSKHPSSSHPDTNPGIFTKYAQESDIIFDDKINIYVFWLEGCPHCQEEYIFLENNYPKYQKYCHIYGFEVGGDHRNLTLRDEMANELNQTVNGVPFTVVGGESIVGFSKSIQEKLDTMIMKEYKRENHIDIYRQIRRKK